MLGKTFGVPLFQEQAMQVAMVCAGFTATQADQLRRAMATFKVTGGVNKFHDELIDGMVKPTAITRRSSPSALFKQIEGFGSYGFPESHAASFAIIAYASSWMKCHHPDVFACALLNAQPMGFYAPAQIVRDARQHGVEIRPAEHQRKPCGIARWNRPAAATHCALACAWSKGLSTRMRPASSRNRINTLRPASQNPASPHALSPIAAMDHLAEADAFACLGHGADLGRPTRAGLVGHPRAARHRSAALRGSRGHSPKRRSPSSPPCAQAAIVVEDYRSTGLTLRRHPVSFLRADLAEGRHGARCRAARKCATAHASPSPASCSCAKNLAAPRA